MKNVLDALGARCSARFSHGGILSFRHSDGRFHLDDQVLHGDDNSVEEASRKGSEQERAEVVGKWVVQLEQTCISDRIHTCHLGISSIFSNPISARRGLFPTYCEY